MQALVQFIAKLGLLIPFSVAAFWLILLIFCVKKREFRIVIINSMITKVLWLLSFLLVNPILMLLYLFFGQLSWPNENQKSRPVLLAIILIVAAAGFTANPISSNLSYKYLYRQNDLPATSDSPAKFNASLATIKSSNNSSSTSSSGTFGDFASFRCRRVMVINIDPSNMSNRICTEIVDKLSKDKNVSSVSYVNFETNATPQSAPDLLLQVATKINNMTDLPGYRTLDAEITTNANSADRPLFSPCGYTNTDDFAGGHNINWSMNLDHTSQTNGFETVPYSLAVKDIASSISESFSKMLADQLKDYPAEPEFPDYLSQYQSCPLPDIISEKNPEILFSGSSVLIDNITHFRFTIDRPAAEVLTELADRFKQAGWKIWRNDQQNEYNKTGIISFFNASKDNLSIQLARPANETDTGYETHSQSGSGGGSSSWHKCNFPATTANSNMLYGRLRSSITGPQRKELLDRLLTEKDMSPSSLFFLEDILDDSQKDKLLTLLETDNSCDYQGILWQARLLLKNNQTDKALAKLKAARIKAYFAGKFSEFKSNAKDIAEKTALTLEDSYYPSVDEISSLGYPRLTPDMTPLCGDFMPGGQYSVYYVSDNGSESRISILTLRAYQNDQEAPLLSNEVLEIRQGGRSTCKNSDIPLDYGYANSVSLGTTQINYQIKYDKLTQRFKIVFQPEPSK